MKGVKVTDGFVTISFRCHEPILKFLTENLECEGTDQLRARKINLTNRGIEFESNHAGLEQWGFWYAPAGWSQFIKESNDVDFVVSGLDAAMLWEKYCVWAKDLDARTAISALEKGETTFQELSALAPYLQDHPDIQKFATKALFEDKIPRKNGRPRTGTRQPDSVGELIAWVTFYMGKNAMTIESAVGCAIENHQHLIPEEWTEPEDALARAYKRQKKSDPQI